MLEVEAEHLSLVKRGLVDVVADDLGTAHKARSTLVEVAGKTGTAEVSRQTSRGLDPERIMYFNRDHAWFAGYAPALSPEIAIVVLVEHGGFGGKHAVPVGMKVLDDWQALREKRVAARASARSAETRGAL
jgi:penicillin-binding protein 2